MVVCKVCLFFVLVLIDWWMIEEEEEEEESCQIISIVDNKTLILKILLTST